MTHKIFSDTRRAVLLGLFLLGASAPAQATLIVNEAATPIGGGVFHYDLSVSNSGPLEIAIVTVNAALADALLDATRAAPAGFLALYDGAFGLLDLVADTGSFGVGSTIGGFSFDTRVAPGSGFFDVFTAIDIAGNIVDGVVQRVPEPMSGSLVGLGLVVAARARVRPSQPRALRAA